MKKELSFVLNYALNNGFQIGPKLNYNTYNTTHGTGNNNNTSNPNRGNSLDT